jgi:hypothetical protein
MARDSAAQLAATITAPATPGKLVDALVPAWADIAVVCAPNAGALHVVAYAHINPDQMDALRWFQHLHHPTLSDPASLIARVFRRAVPELLLPMDAHVIDQVPDAGVRAILRTLGPRTTLLVPLAADSNGTVPRGVLLTAMSVTDRRVDEGDLHTLATFATLIGPRLQL